MSHKDKISLLQNCSHNFTQITLDFDKKSDICTNNYNDFVMEERNKTLGEFIIENQNAFQYSSEELSRIRNSIRLAAKVVNYKVNKAGLVDICLLYTSRCV